MRLSGSVLSVSAALVWSMFSGLGAGSVFAGSYDRLTPEQQAKLQAGQQVVVTRDDPSSAWPKVWVYQRIDSTPEEAAAVFADFESATSYLPSLKKAKISKRLSKNTFEVDYILSVPVLSDEEYTVRDVVSRLEGGASYKVEWNLVRASSTRASTGYALFEPLGTGTLLTYYNFVTPGAMGSSLVRGRALKQVQDTVVASVRQVEKVRTSQRSVMARQLQSLRSMVE